MDRPYYYCSVQFNIQWQKGTIKGYRLRKQSFKFIRVLIYFRRQDMSVRTGLLSAKNCDTDCENRV